MLALFQARPGEDRTVYLFLPRFYEDWAMAQIKEAARQAIRLNKGDAEMVQLIQGAFQQLSLCSKFAQMEEPEHWSTYGFCHEGLLPEWIGSRLIKAK